jgi:signal transduction histidine kinase
LTLFGLPGALDQILTNLMMNSFIHGFEEGHLEGYIFITARLKEDRLFLEYSVTVKGMVLETVE